MYSMRPVFDLEEELKFNSGMYNMNSLQSTSNDVSMEIFNHLYDSQRVILNLINEIKKLLQLLRSMITSKVGNCVQTMNQPEREEPIAIIERRMIHEIVVKANIDAPPYSFVALPVILGNDLNITFSQHYLSSVPINVRPKNVFKVLNNLQNRSDTIRNHLKVRLIWTQGATNVVLKNIPMTSEVSFLRFIHSLLSIEANTSIETVLQCYLDRIESTGLESLCCLADGRKWLLDGSHGPTILDLAVWSQMMVDRNVLQSHPLLMWFKGFTNHVKTKIPILSLYF